MIGRWKQWKPFIGRRLLRSCTNAGRHVEEIMIKIQEDLTPAKLEKKVTALFDLSADKIRSLESSWRPEQGAPVYTIQGRYSSRGWTEWTQGFQFGAEILQFDATGDAAFLET